MVKALFLSLLLSCCVFGGNESERIADVLLFMNKAQLRLQKELTREEALIWAQDCYDKNVDFYWVPLLPVCGNFPEYLPETQEYAPKLHKLASDFYFAAAKKKDGTWKDVLNGLYYLAWYYFPDKDEDLTE